MSRSSSTETGLEIRRIYKSYNKRLVVNDISFTIKRGEIMGFLGPNGAGKTTCFGIIIGLIHPDSGNIFLNQKDITHHPIHQRARMGMGYLPQESSIFQGLSVEKNIVSILEICEQDKWKREQRLEELLETFSITHLRHTKGRFLSGGERRRTELARTLATSPTFILLDEPFSGIDPINIGEIEKLIIHLQSCNIGVLITDHNIRETLNIVDKAIIIYDGRILVEGTPTEIIQNSDVKRVYLGQHFNI